MIPIEEFKSKTLQKYPFMPTELAGSAAVHQFIETVGEQEGLADSAVDEYINHVRLAPVTAAITAAAEDIGRMISQAESAKIPASSASIEYYFLGHDRELSLPNISDDRSISFMLSSDTDSTVYLDKLRKVSTIDKIGQVKYSSYKQLTEILLIIKRMFSSGVVVTDDYYIKNLIEKLPDLYAPLREWFNERQNCKDDCPNEDELLNKCEERYIQAKRPCGRKSECLYAADESYARCKRSAKESSGDSCKDACDDEFRSGIIYERENIRQTIIKRDCVEFVNSHFRANLLPDCKAACSKRCSELPEDQDCDVDGCYDRCFDKYEGQYLDELSELVSALEVLFEKDKIYPLLIIPETFYEWINAWNVYEIAQKNLLQKDKLLELKARLEIKAAYLRNHVAAKFAGNTIEEQIVSGLETERDAIPLIAEKLGLIFYEEQIEEISEYVRWRKFYARNQAAAVAKLRETQMEIVADEAHAQREARIYFQDQIDKAESVSNQIKILGISQEILNQQMISQIPIVVQKEAANG